MRPLRLVLTSLLWPLVAASGCLDPAPLAAQTTTVKPAARLRIDATERAAATADSVQLPVRWTLTGGASIDSTGLAIGWIGSRRVDTVRVPKYSDGVTVTRWRTFPKARAGATQRYWSCLYLWKGTRLVGDTTGYCGGRARQSVLGDPTGIRQLVAPGWSGSQTMQLVLAVNAPTRTRAQLLACSDAATSQADPLEALRRCRDALALPTDSTGQPIVVICAYAADTGGVVWVHRSRVSPGSCQRLFDLVRNGNP